MILTKVSVSRLGVTKHLAQVGHEGMLQLVLCKDGTPSVFLVMAKLVTQLLRSVEVDIIL